MPRKHPQPEEKKGTDPARERERRERRKARRLAKSPANYSGGLLTQEEINLLRQMLQDIERSLEKDPKDERLLMQQRNLTSELEAHKTSLEKKAPAI